MSVATPCPSGSVPTNTGGCYRLPPASVSSCPNIPPPGFTYAYGTCRVVPLPAPLGPPLPGPVAPAPAAPPGAAPAPAQQAAPAQQQSQPAGNSNNSTSAPGTTQTAADSSCGSPIVFDCAHGYMTIGGGEKSTIACGDNTKNDAGLIGAPGKGAGSFFKSMKGAQIVNLVPPPCGDCVVHGIPPQNPANVIAGSSSHGCIHINPAQLKLLQTCQGIAFRVISNNPGTTRGAGSGGKSKSQ